MASCYQTEPTCRDVDCSNGCKKSSPSKEHSEKKSRWSAGRRPTQLGRCSGVTLSSVNSDKLRGKTSAPTPAPNFSPPSVVYICSRPHELTSKNRKARGCICCGKS